MKDFFEWRKSEHEELPPTLHKVSKEELSEIVLEYFSVHLKGSMKSYFEHRNEQLTESVETSRYSVEVNYRTKAKEALEGFAQICLGYVSAALKARGFHTKHVFSEKPLRLLVTTRNWDNGTWAGIVTWHPDHNCFVISKGFYNQDRKTVSIQNSKKCTGDSAAEISKELYNMMHGLKDEPDKHAEKLKPVPLKRGPKS